MTVGVLTACQTVEPLAIDYMIPAEISFPETLKRVAVVNNTPAFGNNQILIEEKSSAEDDNRKGSAKREEKSFWGDAQTATEALAKALAEGNYFDEVVICDSALRRNDGEPRAHQLTADEVDRLVEELDVDFLVALEAVMVQSKRQVAYRPDWGAFLGTIDAKVYSTTRIYLPHRQNAMATIPSNDSIYWEEAALHESDIYRLLPTDAEVMKQASDFAGGLPVARLLPHWTTGKRYIFGGNNVNMRDAYIYVREENWEAAIELWDKEYAASKGKRKMAAAYNLAVGREMQDRLAEALQWADKALAEAKTGTQEHLMITIYRNELQERLNGLQRLQLQTKRLEAAP